MRTHVWVTVAVAATMAAPAVAQEDLSSKLSSLSEREKATLQEALFLGRKLQEQGEHEAALGQFARASKILALPDIEYRRALSLEKLGRDALALQAYERFLKARPETPARAEVEASMRLLRERLEDAKRARVRVTSMPTGASVLVAGRLRGQTPLTLELPAGEPVTLKLTLEGREDVTREVTPEAGTTLAISVVLPEAPLRRPPEEPPEAPAKPEPRQPSALVWALGVGSVLSLGISGAFFTSYALSETEVQRLSDRTQARPANYNDLVIAQNDRVTTAWAWLAFGALLGAGAWYTHEHLERVAPLFGTRGEVGVQVQGRF